MIMEWLFFEPELGCGGSTIVDRDRSGIFKYVQLVPEFAFVSWCDCDHFS